MNDSQKKLKDIAELTGIDPELLNELELGDLTEEKMEIIEKIFNLYLTDQESFTEFIINSGLDNITNNLDKDIKKEIKNKSDLKTLKEKLEDIVNEEELDLNIDI
ncbi:hypothetical protein [Natroniella sp. ANB-PHB2]|uniref:hypothetical protein n=1 Tax=Natroniella sp. ANB-PHB2 TaxID=3384444 RepID=UPI0038D3AB02